MAVITSREPRISFLVVILNLTVTATPLSQCCENTVIAENKRNTRSLMEKTAKITVRIE